MRTTVVVETLFFLDTSRIELPAANSCAISQRSAISSSSSRVHKSRKNFRASFLLAKFTIVCIKFFNFLVRQCFIFFIYLLHSQNYILGQRLVRSCYLRLHFEDENHPGASHYRN